MHLTSCVSAYMARCSSISRHREEIDQILRDAEIINFIQFYSSFSNGGVCSRVNVFESLKIKSCNRHETRNPIFHSKGNQKILFYFFSQKNSLPLWFFFWKKMEKSCYFLLTRNLLFSFDYLYGKNIKRYRSPSFNLLLSRFRNIAFKIFYINEVYPYFVSGIFDNITVNRSVLLVWKNIK